MGRNRAGDREWEWAQLELVVVAEVVFFVERGTESRGREVQGYVRELWRLSRAIGWLYYRGCLGFMENCYR